MKRFLVSFVSVCMLLLLPNQLVEANEGQKEYLIMSDNQDEIVEFMDNHHMTIDNQYPMFSIIQTTLTSEQKAQLFTHFPKVEIQENQQYERSKTNVMRSLEYVNATEKITSPYSGKGVKIAIIDSGIDVNHPDLNIVKGYCSLTINCADNVSFNDDHGHGTHVAGIVGAYNPANGTYGIAPQAELYSVKALNRSGYGSTASLIDSIEWSINHQVDIINLSISTDFHDRALEKAIETAYSKGILITSSSGNNGEEADHSVRYPARYDSVIAVGAINPDFSRLEESAIGDEVEITAPGRSVWSTYPLVLDYADGKRDGYTAMSGTSMATPHVTGVLALYKERFPKKSHIELRTLIHQHAKDLGPEGRDEEFGYGLIQYVKDIPGTVTFNTGRSSGKAVLKTNEDVISIYSDDKKVDKENDEWTIYGVNGEKEIFVTTEINGKELVERQYISLTGPTYGDVNNRQPFASVIGYLDSKGQIKGFPDQTFRPYQNITRAEAAVLIGRALGYPSGHAKTNFTDLPYNSFASGYVARAVKENIVTGFDDGTFRPTDQVTRAEMAILMSKAFKLTGNDTRSFSDVFPSMASYAGIQSLNSARISLGYEDGTFRPYEPITRSEFAFFLARVQNDSFK